MRILILNWRDIKNPKSGGAEIVTLEHAKAWVKKGHSVTWFTSSFKKAKRKEFLNGVKIVRFGNFISVYLFAPFYYFFSGNKFDVVIDQIHGLPFFTPLYVRVKKIVLIHEVAGPIWDYMYPFPINYIGRLIEPIYFKIYKNVKFWTPSNSTINDLVRYGINRKNCIKIHCGINNKVLEKLPVKEKDPTFIFVSRIVRMKGIEDVIKSFFIINDSIKTSSLWIVGEGEKKYIDYLKKRFNLDSRKNVKFFGFVSDQEKLNLMRKAHLLLHASIKEGWGLVIIEAASQATPSVVYNVSGLNESVVSNKTGIVLKKDTPEEMALSSMQLLKNPKIYQKYQKYSLDLAKSLTWNKATKQSLKLIET